MAGKKKQVVPVKPSQILSVIAETGPDLNIDRLTEDLLDAFGGTKEFALLLFNEYKAEGATSIARSNILQSVLRVITRTAEKKSANTDLTKFSNADLEQAAGKLLNKLMRGAKDAA